MEKSVEQNVSFEFQEYMEKLFGLEAVDINTYSPLTLAYIGDCVYDLIIKSLVISPLSLSARICRTVSSGVFSFLQVVMISSCHKFLRE